MADAAEFPFFDLATGRSWTLRANDGPIPWWILHPGQHVPDARAGEYLAIASLLRAKPGACIGETISCSGVLYERLLKPFLTAALNIDPPLGSAHLAAAVVRQTLLAGGRQYRPMLARHGLSNALVRPALRYVERRGGCAFLGRRLRRLSFEGDRVVALDFDDATIPIPEGDAVILAASPTSAAALVPGLTVPTKFFAIANAHYRFEQPSKAAPITGVLNGSTQWLFRFPGRLSVTISAADHLMSVPREDLARQIWTEVAAVAGVSCAMPDWQIVRERRATFAATPEENAKRPPTRTAWRNLSLAGDWTQTGLPATIEGAIRSGAAAAGAVLG